jgi:subtilisin family serine protease
VWPYAMGVDKLWPSTTADNPNAPAIAIVDSGVDASRSDFGDRVVKQVTLTSLTPNSPGDGRGHGTFVADVAAGGGPSYAGAAPDARIVSLDVMDDSGMALTSDVIAAADWIYQNKDAYGIRVANLSLQESAPSSIEYDPLDKAVEKLWLSGVVVVAAAGNFAVDGAESGVPYAPANDPFVITVGAADVLGTVPESDDVAAPWSAYGHTGDGFAKPDIAAPGRYVVAAVPATSTLAAEHPDQLVDGGYMQLSGTSFSAAAVSGVAADLLEAHPTWTPDQVKGALMATAVATSAAPNAFGVGEISAPAAASASNPPNPNGPLSQYVVPDPSGGPTPVFDAEAWGLAVANDPAWAQEAWGLEAWGLEAWGLEAWGLNYWEAPPSALDPGSTSPTSSATPVNVETDVLPAGGYWLSPRG